VIRPGRNAPGRCAAFAGELNIRVLKKQHWQIATIAVLNRTPPFFRIA
jgi:hypothetical protein